MCSHYGLLISLLTKRAILWICLFLLNVVDVSAAVLHASENPSWNFSNVGYDAVTSANFDYDGPEKSHSVYDVTSAQVQIDSEKRTWGIWAPFAKFGRLLAAESTIPTVDRIRQVAQQGFDYAVQNPRVAGLNRMQLGKDAEVQATRWLRRWAERNGVDQGAGGLQFQVRGAKSVPNVVYDPASQIFDFKLTPKAVRPAQTLNFQNDFPGYNIDYIFGP